MTSVEKRKKKAKSGPPSKKLANLHKPDPPRPIKRSEVLHRLFCNAFLDNGGHATKAAIAAGYSEKTAYAQGCRLLKGAEIQARIAAGQRVREQHLEYAAACKGITKERWLMKLAQIAFANQNHFAMITPSGGVKLIPTEDRPFEMGHAIRKVSQTQSMNGGSESIELHDPMRAMELLGKHFGWVKETIEHQGKIVTETTAEDLKKVPLATRIIMAEAMASAGVDPDAPLELPPMDDALVE